MEQREAVFVRAHERMVDDDIPIRHQVLRDYLDWKVEISRATKGIDDALLRMSIAEVKARAMAATTPKTMAKPLSRNAKAITEWTQQMAVRH